MESNQRFGQDLSIRGPKSNSIDYLDENEDFQSSISVIKFNDSLVNLDNMDDEMIEETFHLNKEQFNSNLNDLFEEGVKISLSIEKLNSLSNK
jgi:hypothetical protein